MVASKKTHDKKLQPLVGEIGVAKNRRAYEEG